MTYSLDDTGIEDGTSTSLVDPYASDTESEDDFQLPTEETAPVSYNTDTIKKLIAEQAKIQGVPVDLALALAEQESNFNPTAKSPKGATGVMQLMPATAKERGVTNPEDPVQNIKAGIGYIAEQLQNTGGNEEDALANYNYGPGAAPKARATSTPYPAETNNYIKKINERRNKYKDFTSEDIPEEQVQTPQQAAKFIGGEDTPEVEGQSGTDKDFANKYLPFASSPEYTDLPLNDKLKALAQLEKSKKWSEPTYGLIKKLSTFAIAGAPPEQRPDFSNDVFVGKPPVIPEGADVEKELADWKIKARASLYDKGSNPNFFGDQLDEYLTKAADSEKEAYEYRNSSIWAYPKRLESELKRAITKGVISGVTLPLAGLVRVAGDSETTDEIADAIINKPRGWVDASSNHTLYARDKDDRVLLNPDGTPQTKWMSHAAEILGNVGSSLFGGRYLRAAKVSTPTIGGAFFAQNVLQRANDTYKAVEEQTGDREKAMKATLSGAPKAAVIQTIGDLMSISKAFAPYLGGLSTYETINYAAKQFARGGVIIGGAAGFADYAQQKAEIKQTGAPYNVPRTAEQVIVSGAAGGAIAGVHETYTQVVSKQRLMAETSKKIETAGLLVEQFRDSPYDSTTLPVKPEHVTQEQRERLGVTATPDGNGNSVLTRDYKLGRPAPIQPKGGNQDVVGEIETTLRQMPTQEEVNAERQKLGDLIEQQKSRTLTESENVELTKLYDYLDRFDNPDHWHNVKDTEAQYRQELEIDPRAGGVRYIKAENKWQNTETGTLYTFAKDALNAKRETAPIYTEDLSNFSHTTWVDEDAVTVFPKVQVEQETLLAHNKQIAEGSLKKSQEDFANQRDEIEFAKAQNAPQEVIDKLSEEYRGLRRDVRKYRAERRKANEELAEFNKNKPLLEDDYKQKLKEIKKYKKKGFGVRIPLGEGKHKIIIMGGMSEPLKTHTIAHEGGHVLAEQLKLNEAAQKSVDDHINNLKENEKQLDVPELATKYILPELRKAMNLKNVKLSQLKDSNKAKGTTSKAVFTAPGEYLAHQAGAEMLRRGGVDVTKDGFVVDPAIALQLRKVKLPTIQQLAEGTLKPSSEVPLSETGTRLIEGPPTPPKSGQPEFGKFTGRMAEHAFSERVRKQVPGWFKVEHPEMDRAATQRQIEEITALHDYDTVKGWLDTPGTPIEEQYKPAIARHLLGKAQEAYAKNPTSENQARIREAEMYTNKTPESHAHALNLLIGSFDSKTFGGFIQQIRGILKDNLGDNFKGIPDYALKELEVIFEEAKKAGLQPGSERNDFINEGVQKVLASQGIDQAEWLKNFMRANPIMGVGTLAKNTLYGGLQAITLTAANYPGHIPMTLKAMFGTGARVGWADFTRIWKGKDANLLKDPVVDLSQTSITEAPPERLLPKGATAEEIKAHNELVAKEKLLYPLTFSQRQYNKVASVYRKLMQGSDAMLRRMAYNGNLEPATYLTLKELYKNDPAKFTAEVAKRNLGKGVLDNAVNAAKTDHFARTGKKLDDATAHVRAYEKLIDQGWGTPELYPLIEKSKNWADVVTLRGKLSNPFLEPLRKFNNEMLAMRYGGVPWTMLFTYGNALLHLTDVGLEGIPLFPQVFKYPELGLIKIDPSLTPEARTAKFEEHSAQMERMWASQTVGAVIGTALLGGLMADKIYITGAPEQVLDRDKAKGKNPIGKDAVTGPQFKEYEQTGETPFTIGIKGTNIGFVYKDIPILNSIALGTKGAKDSLDKGENAFKVATNFYRGALEALTQQALAAPYRKIGEAALDVTSDTDEYYEKLIRALQSAGKSMSSLVIPRTLKDIKQIYDPTFDEPNQEFWTSVFKDVPIASEFFGSNPALDVFGRPKKRNLAERIPGVSAIISYKEEPDALEKAMMDRGIIVPENTTTIKFSDTDLEYAPIGVQRDGPVHIPTYEDRTSKAVTNTFTPNEWYAFVKTTGPQIERVTREILASGMDTESSQQALIDSVNDIRSVAKRNFIAYGHF